MSAGAKLRDSGLVDGPRPTADIDRIELIAAKRLLEVGLRFERGDRLLQRLQARLTARAREPNGSGSTRVKLRSTPGRGSVFWFDPPCGAATATLRPAVKPMLHTDLRSAIAWAIDDE